MSIRGFHSVELLDDSFVPDLASTTAFLAKVLLFASLGGSGGTCNAFNFVTSNEVSVSVGLRHTYDKENKV